MAVALRCNAQPATQGQWSALSTWPTRAVHTTLLPDGRVFFISYYSESLQPYIWDPTTNTFTTTAASAYALFCSGHTNLADGRVFIAGGHVADYTGYAHAVIFDAAKNTFTTLPDMNAGRWYPTVTELPNGDVLVVSGDINANTNVDTLPQVFQMSTNSWRNLTTATLAMPLYPNMLVAPNGKVFDAGPSRQSRYLNTSGTGAWSNVAVINFGASRDYGPILMYDVGKVLAVGGSNPPTATSEIIDLNATTPAWKFTGSMHFPRRQHNAVILPDGKVLIVGGSSGSGFDNSSTPVLPTEMWDPATGAFTTMASIAVYRGYHATALLLPDGRVLSGGGNVGGANAQLFSPPYLFAGTRPSINSAPTSAGYGQTVFVGTPDAASITQVTLLRAGSTTHTNDMSQRFMRLSFTASSTGLNVVMPANANIAPPGMYLLFILNGTGVPSVGSMVQVSSAPVTNGTITGNVTNTSGAPVQGASVTSGGNGAITGSDGAYSISAPAGTATVTAALSGYQSASTTVTVTAGASTAASTLQLAPINPGNVTGSVVNSSNEGLSGATVTAAGLNTVTAADGSYALNNLPAGSTTITASLTGFQSNSTSVTVVAATTTAAPTITLTSNSGSITGTVTSAAGGAIASASVGYGGGTATTDSTGRYTLNNVPVGAVQLVASASGFQSATQNVTVNGGATSTANFTLSPVTGGTVTGKVTNISNGATLAGAAVSWSGGSTTTNTSGIYTLTGVTAGTQNITASASGYLPRTLGAGVTSGATTTLNIPLATAGKITAKVVTSTGAVVSGATVTIKGGAVATTVTGTTNTSGLFTTNWIPVGTYTVTAAKTGHTTQSKSAGVSAGVTTTVTFSSF
ncbi:MAG TPA: carboxypeptidase regulatory-like domain-containing protein [Candidatus Angelobacter sp.]|nr:carboxypeptidase regulatory-like domain-containing protein [Candidatus Angelobacter sp.]